MDAADQSDRVQFRGEPFHGRLRADAAEERSEPVPGLQNDEAKAASDEAKDEDDKSKKERKKENDTEKKKENAVDAIDFDGLPARITRAPIDFDNIGSISITGKFIVYSVADAFYYGRDGKFKPQMHVYDIAKRKDKTLVENVENAALSDDGQKLLVQADNTFKVYDVDGDGKDSKTVSTSGLAVTRDPRQEFAEIFREVWRRYRDYFYAVNINGDHWKALRAKYGNRRSSTSAYCSDLNYLLAQRSAN